MLADVSIVLLTQYYFFIISQVARTDYLLLRSDRKQSTVRLVCEFMVIQYLQDVQLHICIMRKRLLQSQFLSGPGGSTWALFKNFKHHRPKIGHQIGCILYLQTHFQHRWFTVCLSLSTSTSDKQGTLRYVSEASHGLALNIK